MKTPKDKDQGLSLEHLRSMLSYNSETGEFVWLKRPRRNTHVGTVAGRFRFDGYQVIGLNRHIYLAHRLAWFYSHGQWPIAGIDHVDGNPSNNRLKNLREATSSQNHANMKVFANNTSGYRGVSRHKCGRWCAEIWHQRKKHYLGLFATKEEASRAHEIARARMFGTFSREAA